MLGSEVFEVPRRRKEVSLEPNLKHLLMATAMLHNVY